uniref:CCR4-NOT transcription complex subunit 1 CAF1-binding domain-containing protein n=1 Tax=Opuntia streptacantha TaxID=393608 RepID=A0A7C9CSI2_OPUST
MALCCVLDALRKAANSKMFAFGTKALEQFVDRLYEWPQYCNHILQISHMHGSHPELVACIEEVLAKSSHCENGPVDQLNVSSTTVNEMKRALDGPRIAWTKEVNSARFGFTMNIQTLVAAAERRETPLEAPTSEIQDQVSFIINNISAATIEAKAKEFSEILNEQYYPWFAEYMVIKRC